MRRREFLKLLTFCFLKVNTDYGVVKSKQKQFGRLIQAVKKQPYLFSWLNKKLARASSNMRDTRNLPQ
jgi:hypothetical protein